MGTFSFTHDQLVAFEARQREIMAEKAGGRQQKLLTAQLRSMIQAHRATKEIKPATIINFNPVPVLLAAGLRYKVPAFKDQVASMQKTVPYRRMRFIGAYLTIEEPHYYPRIIGVEKSPESDMADGQGQYQIAFCRPIESVHHLWAAYNGVGSDATHMGGVIAFEGGITKFDQALHAFKNNPKSDEAYLLVPKFLVTDDSSRAYYTERVHFGDVVMDAFDKQIAYVEARLQNAQQKYNNEATRGDMNSVDHLFGQYALDMGLRQQAPDFLNAKDDPSDTCVGCGAVRKRKEAHFCHHCNRPYDAFAAFMAGEVVAESHLMMLPPEKIEAVRQEMIRRKNLFDISRPLDPSQAHAPVQPAAPAPVVEEKPVADPDTAPAKTAGVKPQEMDLAGSVALLDDMSLEELRRKCDEYNIDWHQRHKRETLINAIREAQAEELNGGDDSESEEDDEE